MAEPTSEPTAAVRASAQAQMLGEGEIIILAVKPSPWYILLVSLPVVVSAAIVAMLAYVASVYCGPNCDRLAMTFAIVVTLLRLTVASWQWLGKTYLLTNLRVVNVRGMMRTQMAFIPLVDIQEVPLAESVPERVLGVGTLYLMTAEHAAVPALIWQSIAQPGKVQDMIQQAIQRARRARQLNGPA